MTEPEGSERYGVGRGLESAQPLEEDRPGLHAHLLHLLALGTWQDLTLPPHRMILGLNEINGVCEALAWCLAHCQCSINVVSQNVFSSSPTCVHLGSAA